MNSGFLFIIYILIKRCVLPCGTPQIQKLRPSGRFFNTSNHAEMARSSRCDLRKKAGTEGKVKMMKREEVKELLKSWGIEEPTDEQITDYLNRMQKEVKVAEDKANKYKADADKVKDLEKQIEELNNANLTDIEKANKATEDAMNKVADLEKTVKQMEQLKALADIGIVGDDANGLFGDDGNLNIEKLGQIIGAKEKAAVDIYKKQALDNTPAPDDKGDPDNDDKGNPLTKDIVDRVAASKKAETEAVSIIDSYK